MRKINLILLTVIISMMFISCKKETKDDKVASNNTVLKGNIRIDGSSTVYPITEAIAEEFRAVHPKVKVTVGVSGTGGGFKKFSRGELDITNASRSIKGKEIKACKKNNIKYLSLDVAYDGLAVLVNPKNDWVDYITIEELRKLWHPDAQGKIMRWSQIRDGWPDEEIHLYGPGTASGTYDYFAEAVCGKGVGTRGDFTASEDDNVLVKGISGDKYGLGFFGLAYYNENKDKLKLVGVDGGKGVIKPTIETVSDGSYSPLSRPIFIYVSDKAAKRPEVQSFINFYLDNGAELSKEAGYIPLLKSEYDTQKEKFLNFKNS